MRTLILAFAAVATPAISAGYYNLPTSLSQCLGMGFGPGYHAPMVMGPMMKSGVAAQRVQRLPAALAPPMGGCFDSATVWSDAPPAEHWQSPMQGQIRSLPAVGNSILMPATHGTGFVGGVEVLPAPGAMGR